MNFYILNHTETSIDCEKLNILEQLEDIVDDNVYNSSFTNNEPTSVYSIINDILGNKSQVTIYNMWENIDYMYNCYYIDIHDSLNKQINLFAAQLTGQPVVGKMVIVKNTLQYTINKNNIKTEATISDISSVKEIIHLFEKVLYKDGIVIKANGEIQPYKYILNPIEHIIVADGQYSKHYVYHEYEIYTHILVIFADTREINGMLNKKGTLLAGVPVNGDIHIAMYKKPYYNEQPLYASICTKKLDLILDIRSKSQNYTTNFSVSEKNYVNFEHLLYVEHNKYKNIVQMDVSTIKGELLNVK